MKFNIQRRMMTVFLYWGIVFLSMNYLWANDEGKMTKNINEWLQLGPLDMPLPALHNEKFDLKALLKFQAVDIQQWQPKNGATISWHSEKALTWNAAKSNGEMEATLNSEKNKTPQITYLAAYLEVTRWTKAELEVRSPHLLAVFLDGGRIATKETSEQEAEEAKTATHTLKLETGKHLLVIKALRDPENTSRWTVSAKLDIDETFGETAFSINTSPRQVMNIGHLVDSPQISGVSISADGQLAAVSLRQTKPGSDKSESWLEIRNTADGSLVQTYRGGTALGTITWAPQGNKFAYTETGSDKTTLWIIDLDTGSSNPILRDIKAFEGFTWAPDGNFIIYSLAETPEKDERGVKRLTSPRDRWPSFRTGSFLYRLDLPEGTRQRLTAGALSTYLGSISPDGRKLLFTQTVDDFENRPYTKTSLSVLDLADLSTETIAEGPWLGAAKWSPDGKSLLITGPPRLFGELGVNVPAGMIANDYDTQAYLFDLASGKPEAITRNFDPAIDNAVWDNRGNSIYFLVTEGEYNRIYNYSLKSKKYNKIETDVEVVNAFDLAKSNSTLAYYGSNASTPPRAFSINLKTGKNILLTDPGASEFQDVTFGEVKRWTFKNARDVEIEGRVYYPPNFDPQKKYPCIVYYYGGTAVVGRDFGGRYPKNLFAAQGYIVYVLQPSGAPGFGQEFSAYHVNDWGNIVAEEIISGTKAFLKAHPFVDEKRVGCIGASYGGFMTMTLVTKTDLFATAISHAGISALSSYWGEGFWGYLYSSVATANSFPWNRKDIYVDQSPLYNADKVNTPILLLHGDVDTNVPPGESDQFYVALKLLGKEVEYIQVADQNHHILDYKKRIIWQKTIFAWFDRFLKDQPQWWEELYPGE